MDKAMGDSWFQAASGNDVAKKVPASRRVQRWDELTLTTVMIKQDTKVKV